MRHGDRAGFGFGFSLSGTGLGGGFVIRDSCTRASFLAAFSLFDTELTLALLRLQSKELEPLPTRLGCHWFSRGGGSSFFGLKPDSMYSQSVSPHLHSHPTPRSRSLWHAGRVVEQYPRLGCREQDLEQQARAFRVPRGARGQQDLGQQQVQRRQVAERLQAGRHAYRFARRLRLGLEGKLGIRRVQVA